MFRRLCIRRCSQQGYSRTMSRVTSHPDFIPDLTEHVKAAPKGTTRYELLAPWLEGIPKIEKRSRTSILSEFLPLWCCNGCATVHPETIKKCTKCGRKRTHEKAYARTEPKPIQEVAREDPKELVLKHLEHLRESGVLQCRDVQVRKEAGLGTLCVDLSQEFSINQLSEGSPFGGKPLVADGAEAALPVGATLDIHADCVLHAHHGIFKAKFRALSLMRWAQQYHPNNITRLALWMLHFGPENAAGEPWTALLSDEGFKWPVAINFVWAPGGLVDVNNKEANKEEAAEVGLVDVNNKEAKKEEAAEVGLVDANKEANKEEAAEVGLVDVNNKEAKKEEAAEVGLVDANKEAKKEEAE
eukprot:TRINITY_DN67684_c6_g1_i1.p1 TRINITY_DN67684_c6_g1~~TRINITY_DN67684_c6_g1_i1.p1  ORF type:complete len:357 (-),score=10.72 TRINITY_DN67684_c6_g1_i1:149-1219(-)